MVKQSVEPDLQMKMKGEVDDRVWFAEYKNDSTDNDRE